MYEKATACIRESSYVLTWAASEATIPRGSACSCPHRFATSLWAIRIAEEVLSSGEPAAPALGFPIHGEVELRACNCALGNNFVRKSRCLYAKFALDVGLGYVRSNDYARACSLRLPFSRAHYCREEICDDSAPSQSFLVLAPSGVAPSIGERALQGRRRGPATFEFGDNPPLPLRAGEGEIPCTSLCAVGGNLGVDLVVDNRL